MGPPISVTIEDSTESDHRRIHSVLALPAPRSAPWKPPFVLKNWVCSSKPSYNVTVEDSVTLAPVSDLIGAMSHAVHAAATRCQGKTFNLSEQHTTTLKLYYKLIMGLASRYRDQCIIPDFRLWLTRFVSRLRRKSKRFRDRARAELCARKGTIEPWTRHRTPRHPARVLEGEEDQTKWQQNVKNHYTQIYYATMTVIQWCEPGWLFRKIDCRSHRMVSTLRYQLYGMSSHA